MAKQTKSEKTVSLKSLMLFLVMLTLVEISAIAVIYSTYRNRALFAELSLLQDSAQEMRVEWSQYLLEQSTLASYARVVNVAHTQLKMESPDPEQIVIFEH
ncbi:MAG: cell division protein FtsL [Pseudomonadales bacterium]|nr:cell division protein FtsL [Pseudomonadales bacterium]